MKTVSVSGSLREGVGKKDAKRLRRQGFIPCVLYGGKEQFQFFSPVEDFKDIVYTPEACLVSITLESKVYKAKMQDIQFHPVSENILHADFLQVFPDKPVAISVPVKLTGVSPGVLQGGKLHLKMRTLKIRGLEANLPDFVEATISNLEIAQSLKVGDLSLNNIEFLDDESSVIVTVKSTRASAAAGAESAKK